MTKILQILGLQRIEHSKACNDLNYLPFDPKRGGIPPIDREIIAYLDWLYPEQTPNPDHSEREIWMRAGERRVVKHLQNILKKQEGNL